MAKKWVTGLRCSSKFCNRRPFWRWQDLELKWWIDIYLGHWVLSSQDALKHPHGLMRFNNRRNGKWSHKNLISSQFYDLVLVFFGAQSTFPLFRLVRSRSRLIFVLITQCSAHLRRNFSLIHLKFYFHVKYRHLSNHHEALSCLAHQL